MELDWVKALPSGYRWVPLSPVQKVKNFADPSAGLRSKNAWLAVGYIDALCYGSHSSSAVGSLQRVSQNLAAVCQAAVQLALRDSCCVPVI